MGPRAKTASGVDVADFQNVPHIVGSSEPDVYRPTRLSDLRNRSRNRADARGCPGACRTSRRDLLQVKVLVKKTASRECTWGDANRSEAAAAKLRGTSRAANAMLVGPRPGQSLEPSPTISKSTRTNPAPQLLRLAGKFDEDLWEDLDLSDPRDSTTSGRCPPGAARQRGDVRTSIDEAGTTLRHTEVVDGQQRVTTCIVLLAACDDNSTRSLRPVRSPPPRSPRT
jgi:hypothetical protein